MKGPVALEEPTIALEVQKRLNKSLTDTRRKFEQDEDDDELFFTTTKPLQEVARHCLTLYNMDNNTIQRSTIRNMRRIFKESEYAYNNTRDYQIAEKVLLQGQTILDNPYQEVSSEKDTYLPFPVFSYPTKDYQIFPPTGLLDPDTSIEVIGNIATYHRDTPEIYTMFGLLKPQAPDDKPQFIYLGHLYEQGEQTRASTPYKIATHEQAAAYKQ